MCTPLKFNSTVGGGDDDMPEEFMMGEDVIKDSFLSSLTIRLTSVRYDAASRRSFRRMLFFRSIEVCAIAVMLYIILLSPAPQPSSSVSSLHRRRSQHQQLRRQQQQFEDEEDALSENAFGGTILFGSCNRQILPQTHWQQILTNVSSNPELFLWTGDAVYAKGNSVTTLEASFTNLTSNSAYRQFVNQTAFGVDGVWDDHDYGVNDAGKLADREERAAIYLRFLQAYEADEKDKIKIRKNKRQKQQQQQSKHEQEENWKQFTAQREGLYHSRTITQQQRGTQLKVIFLDTRYAREAHFVPSVGQIHFPLTALVAAALRVTYTLLGFGREYNGDVLGEQQWQWLEKELNTSQASFHVIVSSIQVFTSNPVVESWGHFPIAKKRLMSLMQKYDPRGLVFLSGDVHHGESSSTSFVRSSYPASSSSSSCSSTNSSCSSSDTSSSSSTATNNTTPSIDNYNNRSSSDLMDRWPEITSSGLTHTCADGLLNRFICPFMLNTFTRHREQDLDAGIFVGRNVGSLRFNSKLLKVSVHDLATGNVVLSRDVYAGPAKGARFPIAQVNMVDLMVWPKVVAITVVIFVIIFAFLALQFFLFLWQTSPPKRVPSSSFPSTIQKRSLKKGSITSQSDDSVEDNGYQSEPKNSFVRRKAVPLLARSRERDDGDDRSQRTYAFSSSLPPPTAASSDDAAERPPKAGGDRLVRRIKGKSPDSVTSSPSRSNSSVSFGGGSQGEGKKRLQSQIVNHSGQNNP